SSKIHSQRFRPTLKSGPESEASQLGQDTVFTPVNSCNVIQGSPWLEFRYVVMLCIMTRGCPFTCKRAYAVPQPFLDSTEGANVLVGHTFLTPNPVAGFNHFGLCRRSNRSNELWS